MMTDKTTFEELSDTATQKQGIQIAIKKMQEQQSVAEEKTYKSLAYPLTYLNKYMTELARILNYLRNEIEIPEICWEEPNKFIACLKNEVPGVVRLEDEKDPFKLFSLLQKGVKVSAEYNLFHEKINGNFINYQVEKSNNFAKRHDFSFNLECVPEKRSDVQLTFFDFRNINQKLTDKELFLRDNNLDFDVSEVKCQNDRDVKAELKVWSKVDINFRFTGNVKTGLIDLEILNFGGMGKKGEFGLIRLEIEPTLVNVRLIGALASFALRQPSELFGIAKVVKNKQVKQFTKQYVPKKSQFKKVNIMKVLKDIHEETQKTNKVVRKTQKEVEKIKVKQDKTQETVDKIQVNQKEQTSLILGWVTALFGRKDSRLR